VSERRFNEPAISTEIDDVHLSREQLDKTELLPGNLAAAVGVSAPDTDKPASPVSATGAAQNGGVQQLSQDSSVANVESSCSEESEVEGHDVSDIK